MAGAHKWAVLSALVVLVTALIAGVCGYQRVGWVDFASGAQRWENRCCSVAISTDIHDTEFSMRARRLGATKEPPDWHIMSAKGLFDHNSPTFRAGHTVTFLSHVEMEIEMRELGLDDQKRAVTAALMAAAEPDRSPTVQSTDIGFAIESSPMLRSDSNPTRTVWKWPR